MVSGVKVNNKSPLDVRIVAIDFILRHHGDSKNMGWLLLGGIILTMGDILMKEWVNTNSKLHLALGLGMYFISLICLAMSFREKNIAVASMMLIIFNILSLALVSWLYFKEPLSHQQLAGLALGIATVVVMESA